MAQRNFMAALKDFHARNGFENSNFSTFAGRVWYVDTINGSNSGINQGRAPGTSAYLTMAKALSMVDHYDIISVAGDVREQVVSPSGVFDVKIIGAGNRPRQATSGGVPTGGGATWRAPASPAATTALLKLIEQAWQIENIQFVPHTSSSCVTVERADGPPELDGSHLIVRNCRFVGGTTANGILFLNGGYNTLIEDNEFESLAGTAILSSGTAVQVPLNNKILRNRFTGCTNAIAISSSDGRIIGNVIRQTANDSNNKVNLVSVSGQGLNNMVLDNVFPDAAANVTIAKGYKPGTGDVWRNYVTDTADPIVTVPA